MILRDGCSISYDLASLFRGRHNILDRWNGTKGPDNPTSQLTSSNKQKQKVPAGLGRKDRQRRWWMIDELKGCMWRVVCVLESCVKDGVWQRCVWKMVCDNVASEKSVWKRHVKGKTEDVMRRERRHRQRRWCRIEQLESCMWKLCVKEGVRWNMVCQEVCVCVSLMMLNKHLCVGV